MKTLESPYSISRARGSYEAARSLTTIIVNTITGFSTSKADYSYNTTATLKKNSKSSMESHRNFSSPFYADLRTALRRIISKKAAVSAGGESDHDLYHFEMPFFINEVGPGNCYCGDADRPFKHDWRNCPRQETHPLLSLEDGGVLLERCRHQSPGRQQRTSHERKHCFDPADEINRFLFWFLAYKAGQSNPRIEAEEEQTIHQAAARYHQAERGIGPDDVYPPVDYIQVLRMLVYQFIHPKEAQTGSPIWKNLWKTHVVLRWEGKTFNKILEELVPQMIEARRARTRSRAVGTVRFE